MVSYTEDLSAPCSGANRLILLGGCEATPTKVFLLKKEEALSLQSSLCVSLFVFLFVLITELKGQELWWVLL